MPRSRGWMIGYCLHYRLTAVVSRPSGGLNGNGCAIAEDLCCTDHRPRIVSNTYDGIGTQSSRVRDHQLKRFLPGGFTQIRKNPDPPAKESP
jgi:hypothetical protein